jgi:limonene-1,2-epoxide hydrolase
MSNTHSDNEQSVLDLFEGFRGGVESMKTVVRRYFADDCQWSNPGAPTTTGPEEAIELMLQFEEVIGLHSTRIEVRHIIGSGNLVMAERLDTAVKEDGTDIVGIWITGVFEFDGPRIAHWREYFDPTPVQAFLPPELQTTS